MGRNPLKLCILGDAGSVHVQRIASSLAARGHTVHLVSAKPERIPGVNVERFEVPGPSVRNLRRWRGRHHRYLRSLLERFDVVNVQFLADWGLTPEIMRHGCVVVTPWGSDMVPPPGEGLPTPELTASRVAILRSATAVTACGPRFAQTVAAFAGIDLDAINMTPFGVDLRVVDPALYADRRTPGVRRVGFYKGFREVYGAEYLVRAIPIILNRLPKTRFDLVGDGPQRSACRRLADRLDLNGAVNWIPPQPHRKIPQWLSMWDVSTIPSLCESFGVAALESSAMCVPVAASDVGGLPDTVQHERTGLLVPPRSPKALAGAIVRLLKDQDLRTRMGHAGREWVAREYEWSQTLDQWEQAFEQARERTLTMV